MEAKHYWPRPIKAVLLRFLHYRERSDKLDSPTSYNAVVVLVR